MAKVGEGTSPRNTGLDHPRRSFRFQSVGRQVWDREAARDSEKGTHAVSYAFISDLFLLSSLNATGTWWCAGVHGVCQCLALSLAGERIEDVDSEHPGTLWGNRGFITCSGKPEEGRRE